MIAEDRDCKEVVQQLVAIRSVVQFASLSFSQDVTSECLLNPKDQDNPKARRATMANLIKLMGQISG